MTIVQPDDRAAKPVALSGTNASASSAIRSPSAKRERDRQRFEQARRGEADERRASIVGDHRVEQAADADAGERDREDEAEGEDRSAEQRSEHPVPDELHQEKREARHPGRDEEEGRKRDWSR